MGLFEKHSSKNTKLNLNFLLHSGSFDKIVNDVRMLQK
jgi:hypothetical protein